MHECVNVWVYVCMHVSSSCMYTEYGHVYVYIYIGICICICTYIPQNPTKAHAIAASFRRARTENWTAPAREIYSTMSSKLLKLLNQEDCRCVFRGPWVLMEIMSLVQAAWLLALCQATVPAHGGCGLSWSRFIAIPSSAYKVCDLRYLVPTECRHIGTPHQLNCISRRPRESMRLTKGSRIN